MEWDLTAELLSAIIICIIIVYSIKGNLLPTMKNLLFQGCLRITFLSVSTNIISTIALSYYQQLPLAVNYILLIIYFICTPLMGAMYFLYTLTNIFENEEKRVIRYGIYGSIAAVCYVLLVLTNPFHQLIFRLDMLNGYAQGDWVQITYYIFYYFVLLSLIIVLFNRKKLDKTVFYILTIFPFVSAIVIFFQFLSPKHMLTGFAAMCSLLIVYLYLQNKQMFSDTMTQLLNRQEFTKMVAMKLNQKKKPFYVAVISLKEFKFINDKFGQQIGNKLLLELCKYLKTIIPLRYLYRYGGDEFAFIYEDEKQMFDCLAKIQERMKSSWMVDDLAYTLNYAIGVVSSPDVAKSEDEIIKGLEFSVVKAKQNKVLGLCICNTAMLASIKKGFEIVTILKEAIIEKSFEVYFQPIYDIKEKRYTEAEALLRLPKGKYASITPDEFIPIAEETGLIVEITYQVLDKACKFVRTLLDKQIDIKGVSVNFSVIQFMQEGVDKKVLEIIENNHVPYDKIKIEITESVLSKDYDGVLAFMERMNEKGVNFFLDDFGTGYSNLSSVIAAPFHTVKIDKSLVWNAVENVKSNVMLSMIAHAFKQLGVEILAEGVENDEQRRFIEECGCDYIQGFYYAKPQPVAIALQVIEQTHVLAKKVM